MTQHQQRNEAFIRHAAPADMHDVVALIKAHAAYEGVDTVSATADRLAQLISNTRDVVCLVAVTDDRVIGYATAMPEHSTWNTNRYLHMDTLFVDEKNRGKGVGRLVFDAVVQHATANGFDEVQWQTPAWNHDAIRFYHRTGAVGSDKMRFVLDLDGQIPTERTAGSNEAILDCFTRAWKRRDAQQLFELLHPACIYEASVGTEPGTTYFGRGSVMSGIRDVWLTDGECDVETGPNIVDRDVIVRTWTCRHPDGSHDRGIDIFAFCDDQIIGKNAYRKTLAPSPPASGTSNA